MLFELQERASEPNINVILDMLATTLVLEDEDPSKIDKATHAKKVNHLIDILNSNPEQLIRLPEYRIFYDSGISGELLAEVQKRSKLTNTQINAILAHN